jgi:hypothetical protein
MFKAWSSYLKMNPVCLSQLGELLKVWSFWDEKLHSNGLSTFLKLNMKPLVAWKNTEDIT